MSKRCAKCGTQNRDEAKRCMECGQALTAGETPVRYCAAGRHPMDPGWTECPYCATDEAKTGALRGKTISDASLAASAAPAVSEKPAASGVPPVVGRRDTVLISAVPDAPAASAETRRIVAMLVTYSWDSAGQVFPIRTGRCFIGSDPHADVCVASDPQMSGRHAVILFRGEQFMIDDEKSLNGTFVNDKPVDQKQPLANYAKIKTGGTVFTFVQVESEAQRSTGSDDGATRK
jgi:hypothetical protein